MIVNVIEIFTEYLSVIFCVHRIAKKKITLDKYVWMFFLLDLFSILLAHKYREEHGWLMMVTYINFFVYVKMRINKKWTEAIKVFGIMLILIPSMQLVIFYCIKFIMYVLDISQNNFMIGIEVNCFISIFLLWGRKELIFYIAQKIIKSSGVIVIFIFWTLFAYLLYVYKKSIIVQDAITLQIMTGIVGVGIVSILWINAENEKKNKAKEVQLYEMYNKTFEQAIIAIRARQHEFDNHINAIRCLQLTIDNNNDLIKAQNEYCDKILKENSFNRLLKMNTEPILIGFLYSKFMNAKEQGISVIHEIQAIDIKNKIEVSVVVEVIGIFIDNAVEALLDQECIDKILIVKILQEDRGKMVIEVANRSRKYLNTEIEKFSIFGYSTKGKNRGIGLLRVKDFAKKYKADFHIENVIYNGDNYLSFKIVF